MAPGNDSPPVSRARTEYTLINMNNTNNR